MRGSLAIWMGLGALVAACGAPPESGLVGVADRDALIEDRVAALERSREAGETAAVRDLLATRLGDADEDPVERVECLHLAGALGEDGGPLAPVLLEVLADEDVALGSALQAADALSRVAPDDPAVFEAVHAKSVQAGGGMAFLASAWAEPLMRFGALAEPVILGWYRSDSGPTRFMAVRAMRHAGAWARPYLLDALNDPEHHVSTTAIDSLIASGATADDVVPVLLERLATDDGRAALAAIDTLGRFGADAAHAVAAIRAAAVNSDPYARTVLGHTLFRVTGALEDGAVSHAIAALETGNIPVQLRAAQALRDYGPLGVSAVPAIGRKMRRTSIGVREELCHALGAIGSPDGVPILLGRLRGEYDDDAENYDDVVAYDDIVAAVRALAALDAREALPALREVAESDANSDWDDVRRLRRAARQAIERLGG